MGRIPIICKHGIRGIANCKDCQREQHTERVRELRRQRKDLLDQENTLQKEWNRENTKVFVNDARAFTKSLEPSKTPSITIEKRGCGSCVFREDCKSSLYYRLHPDAKQCPNWRAWPKPQPIRKR